MNWGNRGKGGNKRGVIAGLTRNPPRGVKDTYPTQRTPQEFNENVAYPKQELKTINYEL